jgi:hypothetical protein
MEIIQVAIDSGRSAVDDYPPATPSLITKGRNSDNQPPLLHR